MTTYVVGDIQGCLDPLKRLLDAAKFDPAKDKLWSAGDIVNRGPRCLDTLRFLYGMRDNLEMVLGNHDLHLLASAFGDRSLSGSDTLQPILDAPDRDELLEWLAHRPLVHREDGSTLVHAGIPPQWDTRSAVARSREVEKALQSKRRSTFLATMYGNKPNQWSEDLRGMKRLRVITNYLTRMRFCTASGRLDLKSKGVRPSQFKLKGERLAPWFEHRSSKRERILFGHWATLQGRTNSARYIGLDTGCVWGGCLSIYALERDIWLRCDCSPGGGLRR